MLAALAAVAQSQLRSRPGGGLSGLPPRQRLSVLARPPLRRRPRGRSGLTGGEMVILNPLKGCCSLVGNVILQSR